MINLIINVNNFGSSRLINKSIVDYALDGIISSISIVPNLPAFEDGMKKLQAIKSSDIGISLNISSHKSVLRTKEKYSKLYDRHGKFKNTFIEILVKSNDEDFMFEVEHEFRAQIETILKYKKIMHITSVNFIHLIPPIFDLVCKLAKEYDIPFVYTYNEKLFLKEQINKKNIVKLITDKQLYKQILKQYFYKLFEYKDKELLKKYNLKTNNCVFVIDTHNEFAKNNLKIGIDKLKDSNSIVEISIDCNSKTVEKLLEKRYIEVLQKEIIEYLANFKIISVKNL